MFNKPATLTIEKLQRAKYLLEQFEPLIVTPRPVLPIGNIKLVTSLLMTIPHEDWSEVRSPGRAARRRKQGHPQRIRTIHVPDPKLLNLADGTIVGHPETIRKLEQKLAEQSAERTRSAVEAAYFNPRAV